MRAQRQAISWPLADFRRPKNILVSRSHKMFCTVAVKSDFKRLSRRQIVAIVIQSRGQFEDHRGRPPILLSLARARGNGDSIDTTHITHRSHTDSVITQSDRRSRAHVHPNRCYCRSPLPITIALAINYYLLLLILILLGGEIF